MSELCKHGIRDMVTNLPYCRRCNDEATRQTYLIHSIRVWLNRAIAHSENGNKEKSESAIKSALEILSALES